MKLSGEITLVSTVASAVFTAVAGLVAWGAYRSNQRQNKPQVKFDVTLTRGDYGDQSIYLTYIARNVGQVSIHMEWLGLRLPSGEMFFHHFIMSFSEGYSLEIVPLIKPMKKRDMAEISPGKSFDSSIDHSVFAGFFRQRGYKDFIKVTPYLGDETGAIYKGKSFQVSLKQTWVLR